MKIVIQIIFLLISLNFVSCKSVSKEKINKNSFPVPIEIINDFSNVFSQEQRSQLHKMLYDYEVKTTKQIVVVTVDSISPYTNMQKYTADLGNNWGVGSKKANNGLTIVLCKPCKKIGIATGINTQLVLTDSICKQVIDKTIIPQFNNEQYYLGIEKGILELIEQWQP